MRRTLDRSGGQDRGIRIRGAASNDDNRVTKLWVRWSWVRPPPDLPASIPRPLTRRPILIDAGEWDGQGELSSGIILAFGDPAYQYKVTFTKAGTYDYVCLIHPGMLGSVTVE